MATFPSISRSAPSGYEWRLIANTQAVASPLTGTTRTRQLPGSRWACSLRYDTLEAADAALIEAFLAEMDGMAGRVSLYPYHRLTRRGTLTGTLLVNGASQTGNSLVCDGAGAATTLVAGDFFSVGGELKQIIETCTADGSGNITLAFRPGIRTSPSDNAAVTYSQPTASFMLAERTQTIVVAAPLLTSLVMDFVEVFA
jgi:hypothetical protein